MLWHFRSPRTSSTVATGSLSCKNKTLDSTVTQAVAHIDDLTEQHGAPAEIALVRYRSDSDLWRFRPDMKSLPATTHAAMLSRLRRVLWSRSIPSVIEFMEPDEYLIWLTDGRTRKLSGRIGRQRYKTSDKQRRGIFGGSGLHLLKGKSVVVQPVPATASASAEHVTRLFYPQSVRYR